ALLWEQECPKVFGQRPGYCAFINVRGSWIVSEGIFADYESGDSVVDQVAVLIPASCYLIDPNTCPGGVGDGGINGPVVSWPPLHFALHSTDALEYLVRVNPVFPVEVVTEIERRLIPQEVVLSFPHENYRESDSHKDQRHNRNGSFPDAEPQVISYGLHH